MPAKGDGAGPSEPETPEPGPKYRRPSAELVQESARRALRRGIRRFPSQNAFRRAMLARLKAEDPLFALGPRRLRALLVDAPGVRLEVRYAERTTRSPLTRCPVCSSDLRPLKNRTLWDDEVVLGYRCTRCAYWTHLNRRVPVRYSFRRIQGREARRDPIGLGAGRRSEVRAVSGAIDDLRQATVCITRPAWESTRIIALVPLRSSKKYQTGTWRSSASETWAWQFSWLTM